jgi:hypothetical protein
MKTKEEIEQLADEQFEKGNIYEYELGFIKGYTQCQQDMDDKWFEYPKNIPPIHSENYLILDNSYIQISLFRGDYNKFQHELIGAEKCNITHWKPLPNKPLNKQD